MPNPSTFYKYYDLLFDNKNYSKEVDFIDAISKKYLSFKINSVLDVGCGTGNHTIQFARKNIQIVGVDIDGKMIKIASDKAKKENLKNIQFFNTTIEKFKYQAKFDVAVSLFHVVTYIQGQNNLVSFFNGINSNLKNGGIYIFDLWNGIAAIIDPPKSKKVKIKSDRYDLECILNSRTDLFKQTTKLTYQLNIYDKLRKKNEHGVFSFPMSLWTPMQVASCLEEAKFKVLFCCKHFNIKHLASEKDWKIMFICQKLKK